MEQRKRDEKEFHDKIRMVTSDEHVADTRWSPDLEETIKNNPLWVNMKYYAVERKSRNDVLNWFKENCKGKDVLDLCCGNGEDGIFIAKNGAKSVTGIDLSDVSIENCKRSTAKQGVSGTITHCVRDAEQTGFEDNSFDVVTEYGALHHVDRYKAFAEIARILRPGGKVICNESLGHNLAIHLYRKMTPELRTEWEAEHIMKKKDFKVAKNYFRGVELKFYHFFTLLAVPFRNMFFFNSLLAFLEALDAVALRLPVIKWQAWQVVFVLSDPIKVKKD